MYSSYPRQPTSQILSGFFACSALCALCLALCTGVVSAVLAFPEPRGYVNDYANILNTNTVSALEDKLNKFAQSTTNELVVVTVSNVSDTTLEDFATRLFETWNIGAKEKDNGVLLLIAEKERSVRIEVGYGLEPLLTDSTAGRIIRDIIVPEFQKGSYDAGVMQGTDAIMQIISGNTDVLPSASAESIEESPLFPLMTLLFFASGILQYVFAFLARSKSAMPGGIIGVALGIIIGLTLTFPFLGLLGSAVGLGVLGYILDAVLSKNYQTRKTLGLPTTWYQSGGGFFGGGGRSGGGFGGFGGGRSGGGGASGRW